MSFQNFVDAVGVPCCILSVEETPEGKCGRICICEANQAYREAMGVSNSLIIQNEGDMERVAQENPAWASSASISTA